MARLKGMLTLEELSRRVQDGGIDTVLAVFTDLYGRFLGKRFTGEFFLDHVSRQGAHACDYLLTVDMEMEPVKGYEVANWEKGYGDLLLVPDLSTLRLASWLSRTALVICDVQRAFHSEPLPFAPRSILKTQTERVRSMGLQVMAGSELEYYLFHDSYRQAAQKRYWDLEPFGWYIEDYHVLQGTREENFHGAFRRHLEASGVPVEGSKGEWGLSQHEVNMRYADALTMADRHCVFKQCAKEVAEQCGCSVTFMAKCLSHQAGSSNHLHLSLWKEHKNAFQGTGHCGPVQCSDLFRWFLGGWLAHVPEFMVFYAPTVNSYKRFREGSWAPTRAAWGYDNRTAGFRVVGSGDSLRIECRIPGADSNPYLALAAAVASGLDGLANRTAPPEMFQGNLYRAHELPRMPKSLQEALKKFEESPFVRQILGEEVANHYCHFFRTEQEAFERAVTDWERARYFERI